LKGSDVTDDGEQLGGDESSQAANHSAAAAAAAAVVAPIPKTGFDFLDDW
jgi:hypothetical protein